MAFIDKTDLEIEYRKARDTPSDIYEHIETIFKYAQRCNTVIELGTRSCVSIWAELKALAEKPQSDKVKLVGVDLERSDNISRVEQIAQEVGVKFKFIQGNCLEVDLQENYDMAFIDTWHVYGQLKRELNKYSSHINKFILLHDTTVDEHVGETVRMAWYRGKIVSDDAQSSGYPWLEVYAGLWPAVLEFLSIHPDWILEKRYTNCNGLTVLRRLNPKENLQKIREIHILNGSPYTTELLEYFYQTIRKAVTTLKVSKTDHIEYGREDLLYIIITPMGLLNSLSQLKPENYIVYQLEQLKTPMNANYLNILKGAVTVWDYHQRNITILKELGISDVRYLPIGYNESLSSSSLNNFYDDSNREIDVAFLGWSETSQRRTKIKNDLLEAGLKIRFESSLNDHSMKQLISRSKICLNLHFEGNPLLETVRLSLLLSNFTCVVSEHSRDPELDNIYESGGVVFSDYSNLVKTIVKLLKNQRRRHELAVKSLTWYTEERRLENFVNFEDLFPLSIK